MNSGSNTVEINFIRRQPNKKKRTMSQAFVRENEEQWLHEISPTVQALSVYLTRENNGVRVYEKECLKDASTNQLVHKMSNGLSYAKDAEGKWFVAG